MGARRASATAVAAVLGGVLLVTLLAVWAASMGPGDVLRGDGPAPPVRSYTVSPSATGADEAADDEDLEAALEREPPDSGVLEGAGIALVLLLVAALLYGAYRVGRWGRAVWQARDRPEPVPEEVEFDVLAQREPLARQLAAGAEAQRDLLREGAPRNAIVAMWNRFEVESESAGARRRSWETSSEFTIRVLEAVDADSVAVGRLAQLYREARFSEHDLTEQHRDTALEALAAIHAGLGRRPVEPA